ncbi:MAG: serine/threonine-protein phosphatase [Oscillospiraceae bacterium]|nr:serine/threonine-protein phosphatase [Oscillospiraceae bacterium]
MAKVEYSAITDVGKARKNNEDNFYVSGIYKKDTEQLHEEAFGLIENSQLLFSVCDGMGGASFGEIASLAAVSNLGEFDNIDFMNHMGDYINKTNEDICAFRSEHNNVGMGTTFTSLLITNDTVTASNIGDSRIYKYSDGMLKMLSHDHTEAQLMIDAGIMKPEEAKNSRASHVLSQSLGLSPEELLVSPYITSEVPHPGDIYLLCSDGLTDMLDDYKIADILSRGGDIKELNSALVIAALNAGGRDNVTSVLIRIADTAVSPPLNSPMRSASQIPYIKKKSRNILVPVIISAVVAVIAGLLIFFAVNSGVFNHTTDSKESGVIDMLNSQEPVKETDPSVTEETDLPITVEPVEETDLPITEKPVEETAPPVTEDLWWFKGIE